MNLSDIDFEITGRFGRNLFLYLLEKADRAEFRDPIPKNFLSEAEDSFFYLALAVEEKIGCEKLNRIIESPGETGETVFKACLWSEAISRWILDREIDVTFIDDNWQHGAFRFDSLVNDMLQKGISPFIVQRSGLTQYETSPHTFEKISKKKVKIVLGGKAQIPGESLLLLFYRFYLR